MTPDERQLISGLFDRMRDYGAPEKDREAEALINQSVRANPDASYMLVQSVLVQEQALETANARIQELEDQLRELEDGRQPRSRGGFLSGGLFGGGRAEEERRPSSVPQVGSRSTPSAYGDRDPWSRGQPPPPYSAPPGAPPPSGGGFMRSALATAAGVAGGMLVADSLRNMLGGAAHAGGHSSSSGGSESKSPLAGPDSGQDHSRQDQDRGYSEKTGYVDEGDNDPGNYDPDNDPGDDGDTDI
jgi:uncharacterized protein